MIPNYIKEHIFTSRLVMLTQTSREIYLDIFLAKLITILICSPYGLNYRVFRVSLKIEYIYKSINQKEFSRKTYMSYMK